MPIVVILRGSVLGERANDVPNSLGDLPTCIRLRISGTAEVALDAGSRTTNFLRGAIELITMRGPVGTVSNVLHDVPQRGSELRILHEHGANRAEECCDVTRKRGVGRSSGSIEFREGRIRSIVGRRGGRRWYFLNVDRSIGGDGVTVTRNFVDVNRWFLWGLVGED